MPDYLSLHSREPACLLSKRNRYALPEACPHICVHGVYKLLSGDPCRFFFFSVTRCGLQLLTVCICLWPVTQRSLWACLD